MIEILWHGRGGQGAFTAARLLGAACSMEPGRHALAFPSFGPERRGAPMRAFTKLDERPIGDRGASSRADYVVYLDETLLGPGWKDELKPGGRVLLNSARAWDDARIVALDADGISTEMLGRAIPNTVFLGALAALCDAVRAEDVCEAIRQYMPEKLHARNLAVVERVLQTSGTWANQGHETEIADAAPACSSLQEGTPAPVPAGTTAQRAAADAAPRTGVDASEPRTARTRLAANGSARIIPGICAHTAPLDPAQFAHTTCYEAGHLVSKNAGWRSARPVLDAAACTRCLLCYMQCPDGTIYKVADEAARGGVTLAVDYDFCKGCGICAKACRCGAIHMAPEHGASRKDAR